MDWFYAPDYDYAPHLPLREVHGFILDKPSRIRRSLRDTHGVAGADMRAPAAGDTVRDEDIGRVHAAAVQEGLGTSRWVAQVVELPPLAWLPSAVVRSQVVTPQRRAAAGTLSALRVGYAGGWACNLSGGFHHARPDLCHGFCLLNDVAIGVQRLRAEGASRRVLVLDLDLHQGDGNAAAFAGDGEVFTASLHQDSAFPHPKLRGGLDVALPDGADDADYLRALDALLDGVAARFAPQVVVYVAGVDPFAGDPMSALRVSAEGLRLRDLRVGRWARAQGCGLVALPAGGYCPQSPTLHALGFSTLAAAETNR